MSVSFENFISQLLLLAKTTTGQVFLFVWADWLMKSCINLELMHRKVEDDKKTK